MSIEFEKLPPTIARMVFDQASSKNSNDMFGLAGGTPPKLTYPQKIYSIKVDELNDLSQVPTNPVAMRVMEVQSEMSVIASHEVSLRGGAPTPASSKPLDRFATATLSAIQTCISQEWDKSGEYEPRLLRVSALYFMALWMYNSQEPEKSFFLPLVGGAGSLVPEQRYSWQEIVSELQRKQKKVVPTSEDYANPPIAERDESSE